MKISISNGISEFDTIEVKTVEEIADKACKSNISTSVFKDGYRNIENFEHADIIGLDIDNDNKKGTPTLSLVEALKTFSGFKHLILSTRNHGVEKNGVTADRFRVLLFLEYPITRPDDFYATWYYLKAQFPWIDNQCKDPSRFWYEHKSVLSINETGDLITPIRYTEPEKPSVEARATLPGERGELSKQTLQFLEFGVEAGSRNGTVYKVAREFQQALYDYEEAESRILSALDRNNVLSSDFPESEAKIAIRSAFSKDAKHAPRLSEVKPRAFQYTRLGDLLDAPDTNEDWLVSGLLLKGGVSLVVGVPKIGKTTLVRQLEKAVLRGEPFLERKTWKGSIFHYSFDEKPKTAKRHYKKLGLNNADPMALHFGTAANQRYMAELEEDLLKHRPALVVIDTLFDMIDAQDVNSYAPIKKALTVFNSLAEKTNSHIMFIHHQNKPNQFYASGSGHSVLGSTAIFGSVDCLLVFEQVPREHVRKLSVQGRAIDDIGAIYLKFNRDKMVYEITDPPKHIDI